MTQPDWTKYGKTRRVEGGLKARSARGAIGETWWSKRFIAVLESFAMGTRLTRGRNYARKGQVLSLEITPGEVAARVQGSREEPYSLTIRFAPVTDWEPVERAIAARALFSAQLLAGEMPPTLEEVFADAGTPLFPRSVRDLIMRCSCPDFAVPCKHIAATFYLLAEAFDADPFQILLWRGRNRQELLAHLGSSALFDSPSPDVFESVVTPALESLLDRYWVALVPLQAKPSTVETAPDLLLRQLPRPGAALGGGALIDRLRPCYEAFGAPEE
jgi:uncharacterized Zn finger protein